MNWCWKENSLSCYLERRLHALSHLENHPNEVQYFWPGLHVGLILDDHIPFLNRGKRLLSEICDCSYKKHLGLMYAFLCTPRGPDSPSHFDSFSCGVAHLWRQRGEPGSNLHQQPQQDPAGLYSWVPQQEKSEPYCWRLLMFPKCTMCHFSSSGDNCAFDIPI